MKRKTQPIWRRVCNARNAAYQPTMTADRARGVLAFAADRALDGLSKVNPAFTKAQVHEILLAAIHHDTSGASLIRPALAKNIGREFGTAFWEASREELEP